MPADENKGILDPARHSVMGPFIPNTYWVPLVCQILCEALGTEH